MKLLLESAVFTPPASPGKKSPPNLRLIGAEDAARLAMCSPDESDGNSTEHRGRAWDQFSALQLGQYLPMGATVLAAGLLTWLIG